MNKQRAAAALASATVAAIMLLGPGSASANPMQSWSTGCGVTVPSSEVTTHNPMLPWGCNEHGPVAPKATPSGVVIDSAGGQ